MSPSVELSPQTFARLQKHAVPLVDDAQSIIGKLLDFYEANGGANSGFGQHQAQAHTFNPASPPDLTHTKVVAVTFNQQKLGASQLNWNRLLDKAIGVASATLNDASRVAGMLGINAVVGRKTDQGYRYLTDAGISVQGQDANGAWRAVYRIAKELKIPFDVQFMWLQKEGVAYAGQNGRFVSN